MSWLSSLLGFGIKKPPKANLTETVGTGGTAVYGGFIQSKEKSPDLQGAKLFETYTDNLVNNATVGAIVRRSLDLIAGAKWKLVPPKDSAARGQEIADAVELLLFKRMRATPWHRVTRKTASFRLIGFSTQEPTAVKYADGLIGWKEIAPRPQHTIERWDIDPESGQVIGVVQRSPQDNGERYLAREKLVYVADDSIGDSPAGVGLLRHSAESVRQLKRYEQLEGYGFETDVAGVPVAELPYSYLNEQIDKDGYTAADRDRELAGARGFVENHVNNPKLGLTIDSRTYPNPDGSPSSIPMYKLNLLPGSGSNHGARHVAIERKGREIARVFAAEFMMMGGDGKGSLAQHKDKTDAYAQSLNSLLTELAWTYDLDVVAPLCRLNGWPEELWPELVPDPIQFKDIEQVVNAITGMAQAGAVLDQEDEIIDDVREAMGQRRRSPEVMARLAEAAAMKPVPPFGFGAPFGGPPDPSAGEVDVEVDEGEETVDPEEPEADGVKRVAKAAGDGVMVALYLPKEAARAVSLTGGADRDSLHVTLAYLGKGLDARAVADTVAAVRRALRKHSAADVGKLIGVTGTIAGVGRFSASSTSDGMDVVYASVDSPAITLLRQAIVDELKAAMLPVSEIHGFTPHVTLAYVPKDAPSPIARIEPTPVGFLSVVVSAGIERIEIPFDQEP